MCAQMLARAARAQGLRAAARSGAMRRMSTEVAEAVVEAPPGPFSMSDPTFQGVLSCVGAIYAGALLWQSRDRALAAELAEKKAAHAAAHPEPEAAPVEEAVVEAPTSIAAVVVASPGASVTAWKTGDVSAWLADMELAQHAPAFKAAAIDGTMLLTLTEADLAKELGVSSGLHRKKIMMGVSQLRKGYLA